MNVRLRNESSAKSKNWSSSTVVPIDRCTAHKKGGFWKSLDFNRPIYVHSLSSLLMNSSPSGLQPWFEIPACKQ